MDKTFSKELREAVEKISRTRGIPLIKTMVLSSSAFEDAQKRNKMSSPTILYVLSNGYGVKTLTQKKRKTLDEFAAIVDVQDAFFMVVFVYKD